MSMLTIIDLHGSSSAADARVKAVEEKAKTMVEKLKAAEKKTHNDVKLWRDQAEKYMIERDSS